MIYQCKSKIVYFPNFFIGVGDVGDVISLIPEYARNHFLLPNKAVYATPENIKKYADIKRVHNYQYSFIL